jgi:hypothetical protein
MRFKEYLLEGEEDFPIIYDLVKKKLAAGEDVRWTRSTATVNFKVIAITYLPVHDMVQLRFHVWRNDQPDNVSTEEFAYDARDLAAWRLLKKDSHWELQPP